MINRFVLYGDSNQGKSTIVGYTIAKTYNINMDKMENLYRRRFGQAYKPDTCYSWIINKDIKINGKGYNDLTGEPISVSRDNIFAKSINDNSRNIKLILNDKNYEFVLIDTPGADDYRPARDSGLAQANIGVFCVEMLEVLKDSFDVHYVKRQNTWSKFWQIMPYAKKNPIVLLTKIDNCDNERLEEQYNLACEKIKKYCGYDNKNTKIIPVSIDIKNRVDINIFPKSKTLSWYKGDSFIETIIGLYK